MEIRRVEYFSYPGLSQRGPHRTGAHTASLGNGGCGRGSDRACHAIGKDLSAHIVELVQTGELARLAEVSAEVPRSLVQIVKLDGVGPKKTKKLWESLGVTTVDELEAALKAGRVESLEGFGATSVAKILISIEDFRRYSGRFLISQVDELIGPLLAHMREGAGRGAYRGRWKLPAPQGDHRGRRLARSGGITRSCRHGALHGVRVGGRGRGRGGHTWELWCSARGWR